MNSEKKILPIVLGPLVFGILEFIGGPETLSPEGYHVLTITVWVAIWWTTEAVPIYVTSLLPIILFPATDAMDIGKTTASYGDKYIFLYLGGFILAITIEKWGLHKRIALNIIRIIGSDIVTILLGFMTATAFLSMWISNTATTVMMLPIGMAVVSQFKKHNNGTDTDAENMGKALMLGIAYSASIGGIATLIGTPPNLVFAGIVETLYGVKISFLEWLQIGLPISIALLFVCWIYLTRFGFSFQQKEFPGGKKQIQSMLHELGKITYEERVVLVVFIATAVLWISRSFLQNLIPALDDTMIGMAAGVLLFALPAKGGKERLIDWKECSKIPWGILLLFGGGMALAQGFSETGLAKWIASQVSLLDGMALLLLMLILVASINFLTEITSNLATTAMILPILAPMALAFDIHPYSIMVSVTIAASCAFMMPVATPPNAVVFGSGYLRIWDMMRSGIWMNIISIILVTIFTYFLLPALWDIIPDKFPENFKQILD